MLPRRPYPPASLRRKSQLLKRLHRIRYGEARFGHHLPTFLGHLRKRLRFAQLVRMLAQLAQDIATLACLVSREVVMTNCDNARHDSDDLRQVLVQRWRWRGASNARENALYRVDDRLSLSF
jgi:hypothetical protein